MSVKVVKPFLEFFKSYVLSPYIMYTKRCVNVVDDGKDVGGLLLARLKKILTFKQKKMLQNFYWYVGRCCNLFLCSSSFW